MRHSRLLKGALLSAAIAAMAASAAPALAEFPEKPIKIIVPFGSGDAIDATARVFADRMKAELGAPVIVQNIPGAGGGKGTIEARKARADGYTLLVGSTGALTARPFISNAGYMPSDFVPLAQLVEVPIALAVAAESPYKGLKDLFEAARKDPGAIKYATPAPGTTQHINMEAFARAQGVKLTHIGGRGGKGAVTKALSGEVDFVFVGATNYTALAEAGKLRVLGVAAEKPVPYLAGAPTFRDQGFDLVAAVWFGLLTRKGTDPKIVDKLTTIVESVAKDPKTGEVYGKLHLNAAYLGPADFQKRIEGNVATHKVVLKEIGLIK